MKNRIKEGKINALLGAGTTIKGNLEFEGTVRLNGNVTGKIISTTGTVVVEKNALIKADILVGVALISGEVNGTVKASEKIELYPSARIKGDLISKNIRIESGAQFIGNCCTSEENNFIVNSAGSGNYNPPDP